MTVAELPRNHRILTRPRGGHCAEWDFQGPRLPRLEMANPVLRAVQRREQSVKVSREGWKTLIHAMRAR